MDIPYGFDCYSFKEHEVKLFDSSIINSQSYGTILHRGAQEAHSGLVKDQNYSNESKSLPGYIRFTRKNEYYTTEQLQALTKASRLNESELTKQIFCGVKIQVGIGVVTNFLKKAMQYRRPNKGKSFYINGTWDGIVSGLTVHEDAPNSYDMAFGNFLAYDEEFPYMKFGPFFTIESKLVLLTGSPRRIVTSSFGTNIQNQLWITVLSTMIILSVLASFRVRWKKSKYRAEETAINQSLGIYNILDSTIIPQEQMHKKLELNVESTDNNKDNSFLSMVQHFFFIYFTMLLNKPSYEFDDLIWPKQSAHSHHRRLNSLQLNHSTKFELNKRDLYQLFGNNEHLKTHYHEMVKKKRKRLRTLPTSIRVLSYLWSAACLVMGSIYSGELLAVILLHADQNIDTINQLINSKPPIEPVIRQDDYTYNLMLKSLDTNMLILHNKTKIIPRPEVYTKRFIESVSERKQALLGDDELIETIYEIYHKHFPLYRSKVTYLQYPISILYRKDLNRTLEAQLRRGMKQLFEMGLIQRWYQAQKETYIQFYDTYEKKNYEDIDHKSTNPSFYSEKYKPLSMHHFKSFFKFMLLFMLAAFIVLALEILHFSIIEWKSRFSKKQPYGTNLVI